MTPRDAIEVMAAVEHERWAGWHRYAKDLWTPEKIAHWDKLAATPYCDLAERSKEADRVEVRKTIAALSAAGFVIVPREPTAEMLFALYGPPMSGGADKMRLRCFTDMLAAAESDDGK